MRILSANASAATHLWLWKFYGSNALCDSETIKALNVQQSDMASLAEWVDNDAKHDNDLQTRVPLDLEQ